MKATGWEQEEELRGASALCNLFANFLNTKISVGDAEYATGLMEALEGLWASSARQEDSALGAAEASMDESLLAAAKVAMAADAVAAQERLAVARTRYVRGLRAGNSVKPPFESLYLTENDSLEEIASVAGAYRTAGFQLTEESLNRPDSLATELSFLAQLFGEAAQAVSRDDIEAAHALCQEADKFTRNHLGKWGPFYCEQAAEATDSELFRLAMILMGDFIKSLTEEEEGKGKTNCN